MKNAIASANGCCGRLVVHSDKGGRGVDAAGKAAAEEATDMWI
jgi:hypothetical protein